MRSTLHARWLLPLTCLLGTACTVPRLDIASKACPCAAGWTCDVRANACVRGEVNPIQPSEEQPNGGKAQDAESVAADSSTPSPIGSDAGMEEAGVIDAATSDASVADAALPDAAFADATAPDAAAATCQGMPDTTWLYDSFEAGHVGFTTSSYGTGSTINTRYAGFSHSGSGSLRAEATQAGKSAGASQWLSAPVTNCTLYLSTYLFVDASAVLRSFTAFSLGDQMGQDIRLLYTQQGLRLQLDATATTLPLEPKVEVVGRWVRFELVVTIGVAGTVTAYVDGNQAGTLITNTERPLGYSHVRLGILSPSADQGPIIMYADDFVLKRLPPTRP